MSAWKRHFPFIAKAWNLSQSCEKEALGERSCITYETERAKPLESKSYAKILQKILPKTQNLAKKQIMDQGGGSSSITIKYIKIPNQKEAFREFLCNDYNGIDFRGDSRKTLQNYPSLINRFSKIIKEQCNVDFDLLCFKGSSVDIDRLFTFIKNLPQDIAPKDFIKDVNSPIKKYKSFNDKHLQSINGVESTIEIPL